MQNTPVKYLGTFVGSGNLSKLNFELTLRKACRITSHWSKRNLTLPARVLICKTFIFSTFVHVCNCSYITTAQVKLLQKVLNEFLWRGQRPVIMYTPVSHGGLNMINIKNTVHVLQLKWMDRLYKDVGSSWSRFVWNKIERISLMPLMAGIRRIRESDLHTLSPFYWSMLRSYAYLNKLFYEANTAELLPRNIWFTLQFPFVDKDWHLAGINTLSDLPLANGKIVISNV